MSDIITIIPNRYSHRFTVRLTSPLIHTEEVNSNVATFYREPQLINGKKLFVPTIRGNSIRGKIRDLIFDDLLERLEYPKQALEADKFYTLFCGGFLDSMETGLDILKKRELRDTLPALSLLGSALGKEMLKGKLIVAPAYPKVKERGYVDNPSIYDITSINRMIRLDDGKLSIGDQWLEYKTKEEKKKDKDQKAQMFYDVDCVITGTEFDCFFAIDSRNELEQSCFDYMIQLLIGHSHFGGKNSSGFGSFEVLDMPELKPELYLNFLVKNKLKIKEYIDNVFLQ
jgi:hypothetical protein